MKIELWADIVCPYCGLMDNRLRLALDRFEHADDVQVIHRSIQLHPDLPREGVTQRRLFQMAGMPTATGEKLLTSIEATAHAEGLSPYHALERTLGPTDHAHELLAHATAQGRGNEVWTAMFRAHFGQARKLWTLDEVLDFAEEVGLDRGEAAQALRERRYRAQVEADQREAERLGARGAPFLVIDGAYAVPGALDTDRLLAAMTRAWRESHPAPRPLPVIADAEGLCGPDGCAVPQRPAR
ncbi:DsbA family oxidoreductase [Streptosporangium lutulentum]|uniref:DsbA family dithiol-disulfide isomerase n=1 Tax=Streptosporangium lutulentum TaxID=1461250 RepID=A0ABT9QDI7_9ACTN|nr:DsbA family protein [Streptosporangium lutulentum]MDP9844129.1 putative DsbA family dithiol-disulfide isomerase [Streptosporangium lutulentum]